jgi:hypothetical protein
VLRVFAIQIQKHFRFEADWYRTGVVAGLALQYYALLRSVLRTRVPLRQCLTRCRHCGIFFVADARNAGRRDLGCPFGCAAAHRRREWNRHSAECYQGKEGKRKKSAQNQRRKSKTPIAPPPSVVPEPRSPAKLSLEIPPLLVQYVQRVVSQIEGRPVSRAETLAMLAKEKRQHSMVRQRRVDQIIRALHERPP